MIIRKTLKFENAHVVRNCYSTRCKYSIHGHSYTVEVILEANKLDRAGMVMDFGVFKHTIAPIIDSWDHATSFWVEDDPEYVEAIKKFSARWISMPVSPSAEQMSRVFFCIVDRILATIVLKNGEDPGLRLSSVRVHETATGYAECFRNDAYNKEMGAIDLEDVIFSDAIKSEWEVPYLYEFILDADEKFDLPEPEQQVK